MTRPTDQQLSARILEVLGQHPDGVRIRKLVRELGLTTDSRRRVRRLLQGLVREAKAISDGRGLYRPAGPRHEHEGVVERRGGGWMTLEPQEAGQDPLRIPPDDRGGAYPGDRVRAVVMRRCPGGVREGKVTEIVERSGRPLVGTYRQRARATLVEPDDPHLDGPILVDRRRDLTDGTVVAVRIDDPLPQRRPRGVIVRVLGEAGELTTELDRLILEHDLHRDFPPEVEAEAAAAEVEPATGRRADLRHLPHVTIDPADAKDFDDAVLVEPDGDGFLLRVSIADVATHVRPDGAIDRAARVRGCSVYFPGQVFPMLPARLSEEVCTLAPGRDRDAVTVEMHIGPGGAVRDARFVRSRIRSAARLTYQEVQDCLDGRPTAKTRRFQEMLEAAAACARALLDKMKARGMLDMDLPGQQVELDDAGAPARVAPAERLFAHRIVEMFMIAANEAVAGTLLEAGAPAIFRIHPAPDPEKLEAFADMAETLGAPVRFGDNPSPRQLAAFLDQVQERPGAQVLNGLLLRSLMQARYSPDCEGHYGLASERYLHFTSPIRRYPDLAVHRQLGVRLDLAGPEGFTRARAPGGVDWALGREATARIAEFSSRAERRALEAERAALDLYQAAYMQQHVGEEIDGTVAFVMDFGVFVRMQPSGVEGLVHIASMRDDYYRYDQEHLALVGKRSGRSYRIGMPVRVRVESVALSRRQIDLVFVPA